MKRLLGGGVTGQLAAIIVVSLLAVHGLAALLWFSVDMRPGPPPEYIRPASAIGLVMHLLDALPQEDHQTVLTVAAANGLRFIEGSGPPPTLGAQDARAAGGMKHAITAEAGLAQQTIGIGSQRLSGGKRGNLSVLISRSEQNDRWILFDVGPDGPPHGKPRFWLSPGGFASFATFPLLIAAMSLWATRRITGPLVNLAMATENVSILGNLRPVDEAGAREVRQVARAFNTVLIRLQRFVADRTYMLASISHDLRTPLTRIKLRAETVDNPEMQRKMLADIRTMEAMITATLAFIRDEAKHEPFELVDLAVLLQTVCHEFSDSGANVEYEGPLHAAASCRPEALRRAITNLIDNASRFEGQITVTLTVKSNSLVVTVEDERPGIPDAKKEAVLAPFFRDDSGQPGANNQVGLGLSIVESIVQSHNGRMELLDRAPHGLCVRISIPVTQ